MKFIGKYFISWLSVEPYLQFWITNVYSLSSRINKVTTVPEAFSWGFCTGCLVAAKQPRKDSKNCCGKTESALVVEAHFCRTSVTRV